MEITAEQFEQFEHRLQEFDHRLQNVEHRLQNVEQGQRNLEQGQRNLEQGQRNLEQELQNLDRKIDREIAAVKQLIAESQVRVVQWVVGLFIGSTVVMTTLGGVYISVLLSR